MTVAQAQEAPSDKPKNPPITVLAYQLQAESIAQNVNLIGTLQAVQSIEVRATVTDSITALPFVEGQSISKGAVIVKLNAEEEQAELKQAQIISAEAKRQYLRAQKLIGRGNITEATLDELKAAWHSAEAQQTILQARINDRTIRAPFAGRLGFKAVHEGALVSNNSLITTLDNTEQMYLDVQIPDPYLQQLQLGQNIQFSVAEQNFSGAITVINPRINPESRLLQMRALVNNPDALLKSGMQVQVQLNLGEQRQLLLPETAVLMQGEKNFVYVVQDSQAQTPSFAVRKQPITIGKRYFGQVQVTAGLQAGDVVVSQGILRLKPKSQIKIKAYQDKQPLEDLLRGKPLEIPNKTQVN
ncbi:MexH family multidrug efflux RND transporter periplasmic adaptor subunit [Thiosulfatimonas sediminis]|uniref:MexH family multidrug efflux RND transporter periplasmic adaptor subunit n=2 Tax=Thiosulfatimonas sediminis TaxID=2675054 RepID=A0A6F8PXZ4_9GAMM|nr:MexH family multidrug efflux RND transporter periplasmic adaptor subunit [Thiosulfatimonas sediminis]